MADDPRFADARIWELDARLAALERRVAALERHAPGEAALGAPDPAPATGTLTAAAVPLGAAPGASESTDLPATLSLVGRTCIVLGGAYLLRALTESGTLQRGTGVALGLAYAVAWLVAADRAAARGRSLGAQFHGVTALLIALPLLWEALARARVMGPLAGAAALALVTAVALLIAWRGRLQAVAGTATLGAIGVAVLLVGALGSVLPFAVLLVLLGVATLWLGYDREWYWLRWIAAAAANLVLLGLVSRALGPHRQDRPEAVVAVLLFMLTAYLGSFAARTLWRGRLVILFEAVQGAAALAIGLGGALAVTRASGTSAALLGAPTLAIGAGAYAVAFAFVGRRQGLGTNFYFYATLALLLTLGGLGMVLSGPALGIVCAGLAILATWSGWHLSRLALTLHGAVYAGAACLASGLLASCGAALAGGGPSPWPTTHLAAWVALAALVATLAMPRPAEVNAPAWIVAVPRVVVSALLVIGAVGAAVVVLAPALAGSPPDPGRLATLRTTVMALAIVGLALATRARRTAELGWLLYPVLALGAAKLLLDDLRHSQAATLFLALAVYGIALVAAPRLARRTIPPSP